MSLLSDIKKRNKYEVDMICPLCGFPNKTLIPKGIPVEEFINTGQFKCDNCGCNSKPDEYKTKWLK